MKNLFALVAALGISVAMVGCGETTTPPVDKTTPADTATTPPADAATTAPGETAPPADAPKDEKKE